MPYCRESAGRPSTLTDRCVGRIGRGWLVLLGVAQGDTDEDVAWMADKVLNLRGFEDEAGKMNRSVLDIQGGILVVSQFTLAGRLSKRPAAQLHRGGRTHPRRAALSAFARNGWRDRVCKSPPASSAR